MLFFIDMIGTAVFAISGFSAACSKKYDIFGAFIISSVTALGGGTLRDILLNRQPMWMTDISYLYAVSAGVAVTIIFKKYVKKLRKTLNFFDSIGLGLFTVYGTEIAISYSLPWWTALLLGLMTSSFGGVLRDLLLLKKPLIFRDELYAIPAILGSLFYFILRDTLPLSILTYSCIVLISTIRMIAVKYQLRLPKL